MSASMMGARLVLLGNINAFDSCMTYDYRQVYGTKDGAGANRIARASDMPISWMKK